MWVSPQVPQKYTASGRRRRWNDPRPCGGNITIYGNGATVTVSSGEQDLEIDTYQYDRETGERSDSGEFLKKDITVKVYDLNGIAAWGQRNTGHTINLEFYNCKNMDRVYFTNTNNSDGVINITLDGCSFCLFKLTRNNFN